MKGKRERKLEYALAKMGFAFLKCKEKFYYIKHRIKEEMRPRFDEILPRIGINDIHYKSSLIRDDYTAKSSTTNHVYGLKPAHFVSSKLWWHTICCSLKQIFTSLGKMTCYTR